MRTAFICEITMLSPPSTSHDPCPPPPNLGRMTQSTAHGAKNIRSWLRTPPQTRKESHPTTPIQRPIPIT